MILGIIGAFCLPVVALRRGEHGGKRPVDRGQSTVSVYLVTPLLQPVYRPEVMKLDPTRATPAVINNDGLRTTLPTNRYVLFGHRFAASPAQVPLVGPVHWLHRWVSAEGDTVVTGGRGARGRSAGTFMVLFISSRLANGASLGEMIKEEMGTVPSTIALFGCFLIA